MSKVLLALVLLAGATIAAAAEEALVGHWQFDEGQGVKAADASPHGNHGILKGGASWTAEGRSGGALTFDGDNSWVQVPPADTLNLQTLTMSLWVKAEAPAGVMCFSSGASWEDERAVIHFYASKGIQFTVSNGKTFVTSRAAPPLPLNNWVHIAVTYDGKAMRTYQNGALIHTVANTSVKPVTTAVPLKIGRVEGLNPNFFKGGIDEVKVYNRALSAEEIKKLAAQFDK